MAAVQPPAPVAIPPVPFHRPSTPRKASHQGKQSGTPNPNQNRIFKSISKFLTGHGKSRPKLAGSSAGPSTGGGAGAGAAGEASTSRGEASTSPSVGFSGASLGRRTISTDDDGLSLGSSSIVTNSEGAPSRHHHHRLSVGDPHDDGASGISGADTDASIRPISPHSLAPSSIISTSGNTGRTFKSYASTKPTTLLSIDSGGGANRIAVVPPSHIPSSSQSGGGGGGRGGRLYGHSSTRSQDSTGGFLSSNGGGAGGGMSNSVSGVSIASSGGGGGGGGGSTGITFSALPSSSPPSPIPGQDPEVPLSPSLIDADNDTGVDLSTVPHHTLPHPRNNPHPASPPPDNASMLTLASSSFAPSFFRSAPPASTTSGGGASGGGGSYILSGLRSRLGVGGGGGGGGGSLGGDREADEDASVRALAGSRRQSEESLGSRSTWSAAVLNPATGGGNVRGDRASLRTMATGKSGDIFAGSSTVGSNGMAAVGVGGETAAQEVVRKEGEGKRAQAASDSVPPSPSANGNGTMDDATKLDASTVSTPTTEQPSALVSTIGSEVEYQSLLKTEHFGDSSSFVSAQTGNGTETEASSFKDAESGRSV